MGSHYQSLGKAITAVIRKYNDIVRISEYRNLSYMTHEKPGVIVRTFNFNHFQPWSIDRIKDGFVLQHIAQWLTFFIS